MKPLLCSFGTAKKKKKTKTWCENNTCTKDEEIYYLYFWENFVKDQNPQFSISSCSTLYVVLAAKFVTYCWLSSMGNWQHFCGEILSKRLRFLHRKDLGCDIVSIKFYKAFDIGKTTILTRWWKCLIQKGGDMGRQKNEVAKKKKPLDLKLDWYKNFNIW